MDEIEGKMSLNAVFPLITIKHGNVMIDGSVAGTARRCTVQTDG